MLKDWTYSTPEAEGMNGELLNELDDYIKRKRYRLINSVLVVKNGKIVFTRNYNKYDETSRNNIKSIWKSILSIVVGICIDKGLIRSVDEPISHFLQEFNREIHPYHRAITIRHLLTMTSGIYWNGGVHYHCPMVTQMMRTKDWMAHMADIAMRDYPGTRFEYKEWDVMLLSAVIGKAASISSFEVCREFLNEPLGISSGTWPESPCGFSYTCMKGEEQSDLSANDLAKIGQLFLNKGVWDGKQIVSERYVVDALSPSPNNSHYGYLWWLSNDSYGCRGYGGQEINVWPEHNFVSVIQATATASSKQYNEINDEFLRKAVR